MPPAKRLAEFDFREFKVIVAMVDRATFACHAFQDGKRVAEVKAPSREQAESEIKARLLQISADYIGLDGARGMLLRHFPQGFSDERYKEQERAYKLRASAWICDWLTEQQLRDGDRAESAQLVREAASKTNLLASFELIKLNDAIKSTAGQVAVVDAAGALLYGPDFDRALAAAATSLRSFELAKWPILTYLPYLRFPERHMFLKPQVTNDCADRLGFDLEYEPTPNARTYARLLAMAAELRAALKELKPNDNIDIQSAIWALGDEEYRRSLAEPGE